MLSAIETATVRDIIRDYAEGYAEGYRDECINHELVWATFIELQATTRIARGLGVVYRDILNENGIMHTNGFLDGGVM